jgi:hypothetical protein
MRSSGADLRRIVGDAPCRHGLFSLPTFFHLTKPRQQFPGFVSNFSRLA